MPSVEQTSRIYQELATLYAEQGQAQLRDRFLVLAADALHAAGRTEDAERVRARLLQVNPHHLIKPFASFDQAMGSTDVKNYVTGLRRTYPPDKAAQLLEQLRQGGGETPVEPPAHHEASDAPHPERKPPAHAAEEMRVYRFQDDIDPQAPLPRTRPEPLSRPAPKPVPPAAPRIAPIRPAISADSVRGTSAGPRWQPPASPHAWDAHSPDGDPSESPAGAWVALGLFWVLLLGGLALAAWTFAGPFLL